MERGQAGGDQMARLAVCVVVSIAAVYAVEKLCEGKGYPLWEKYGPWIKENRVQAIAIAAAALYGAALALWPPSGGKEAAGEEEFTPCV